MEPITNEINVLRKALLNDSDYYYSWQANIAMAFLDEFSRNCKGDFNRGHIHKISNQAAKNFLDTLIGSREDLKEPEKDEYTKFLEEKRVNEACDRAWENFKS